MGGWERHVPSQPSETAIIRAMGRSERFIVATPICDGHDVAAVAVSRLLRREGAEAVYIGFNKSARQIVKAAAEEDATGIAISTYNGGHASFLREVLREQLAMSSARSRGLAWTQRRSASVALTMPMSKVFTSGWTRARAEPLSAKA